jgi:hypothetical protein
MSETSRWGRRRDGIGRPHLMSLTTQRAHSGAHKRRDEMTENKKAKTERAPLEPKAAQRAATIAAHHKFDGKPTLRITSVRNAEYGEAPTIWEGNCIIEALAHWSEILGEHWLCRERDRDRESCLWLDMSGGAYLLAHAHPYRDPDLATPKLEAVMRHFTGDHYALRAREDQS